MINFKALLQTTVGRFTGDTDVLEGILAIGIGVAAADGRLDKEEVATVLAHAKANSLVTRLFTNDVIDSTKDKFLVKVRANRMEAVWKELRDIAGRDEETRHAVYTAGCAVAAHGGIDAKEQAVLDRCADLLNLTAQDKADIEKGAVAGGDLVIDF